MVDCIVISGKKVDTSYGQRLADQFKVPLVKEIPQDKFAKYFLLDKDGLSYITNKKVLKGDLTNMVRRVTGGHLQHEILIKAIKMDSKATNLRAVDATAGMGEDAFILAALGYKVDLIEHNPITHALLKDSLIRGKKNPDTKEIVSRMNLLSGDSKDILRSLNYNPDIIYLDPMYPDNKSSAESKNKLQVLHSIEPPCQDEIELLQAAIEANPSKIIIKRPPEANYLANHKPTYQVIRKAVRYDCISL